MSISLQPELGALRDYCTYSGLIINLAVFKMDIHQWSRRHMTGSNGQAGFKHVAGNKSISPLHVGHVFYFLTRAEWTVSHQRCSVRCSVSY